MATAQVVSPMNCLFYPQEGDSEFQMMMNPSNAGGSNYGKDYYSNSNSHKNESTRPDDTNDQAHPFLTINTETFGSEPSNQEDVKKASLRSLSPSSTSSKGMTLPAGFVPGPFDGKSFHSHLSLVLFQAASDSATYAFSHRM